MKGSSSKQDQKPGAVARRAALQKEPRTLERALSFELQHRRSVSRGPSQIVDLMRATSASIPSIKREDSDSANLKAAAKREAGSRQDGRASLSRSSSMVGLEDKANKKAKIEAELRDAISNLRKPNREVVSKAMAEAAERKASTASSAKSRSRFMNALDNDQPLITQIEPRKAPKPVAVNSGVQVKATPVSQRFRDVMARKSEEFADTPLPSAEDMIPPSSVGPLAPPTVLRSSHKNVWQNSASPSLNVVGHTPLKQSTGDSFLRRSTYEEPAIPPSSPLMARKMSSVIPGSAVKPINKPGLTAPGFSDVPVTPVKNRTAPGDVENELRGQQEKKQASIYQRLGWDDDELDDLL